MFKFILREPHLPKPKCAKRNDKNSDPFRTMQGPAGQKTARRNICCPAADAERLSSRFLAHFPDESVVIKMEQRRSGHHTSEHAFDCVDADVRFEIAQGHVGEDQAHIKTNQRATAPEYKTHKTADRAICLNPFAIVNPNQGEVLDIVKYFEQGNADENAGHDVVAVPPKRNTRDKEHQLYRTWSLPADPHPDKICQK